MTATLPAGSPALAELHGPSVDRIAIVRVWDAMFRGARSYVERHGFVSVGDLQDIEQLAPPLDRVYACRSTRFELEHMGSLDELVDDVTGIVQAAAREVVARCHDELRGVGRNPDDLRNIRIGRVADAGLDDGDEAALVDRIGPCFVARRDDEGERVGMSLLLPKAAASAEATERGHEVAQVGAWIDMERVAQFLLGMDDIHDAVPT